MNYPTVYQLVPPPPPQFNRIQHPQMNYPPLYPPPLMPISKTPTILRCEEQRIPVRITNSRRPTICQPFRSTKHLTSVNLIKIPITETPKVAPFSSTNILPCFLLLNACHISNKTDELSAVVAINKPIRISVKLSAKGTEKKLTYSRFGQRLPTNTRI